MSRDQGRQLIAPFGTWTSPLSAAAVASAGLRLNGVQIDGDDIYWIEGRPQEGGSNVLVRRAAAGTIADVTPREINVRTRVHEYGGGAYLVVSGVVYCSNFADQRVYEIGGAASRAPAYVPEALTSEGYFFADYEFDRTRNRLIAVREDHTG